MTTPKRPSAEEIEEAIRWAHDIVISCPQDEWAKRHRHLNTLIQSAHHPAASEWQSIESAEIQPFEQLKWWNSGPRVLGLRLSEHSYYPVLMSYGYTQKGKGRWLDHLHRVFIPTHWMPLPLTPKK